VKEVPAELIIEQRKEKIKFTCADQAGKRGQSNVKQRIFQKSLVMDFCFMENSGRNILSPKSFSYGL
jgi:hypothetical protein